MDTAALNEAKTLIYRDPKIALLEIRDIEILAATSDVSETVRTLRTNSQKRFREYRQAAIFCYGISLHLGTKVLFCPVERNDYDFIATWQEEDARNFAPVQLKELVPTHLNPAITLDELATKLVKYKSSEDLTVVIFLNRDGSFSPSEFKPPLDVKISGLWVVAKIGEDRWRLVGDFVHFSSFTDFDYPTR